MEVTEKKKRRFNPVRKVGDWYVRFERPISSLSLIGGFVFDALTLKRVDTFWENFWILFHLSMAAIAILLINREENEGAYRSDKSANLHFWLINILQFMFGGLLSAFLVFYFRSGSLSSSWPFLILLTIAFAANERLKGHFERLVFQISMLFLSIYSFAIFILPVILHKMNDFVFILSGLVSLSVLWVFMLALKVMSKERLKRNRKILAVTVIGIFATMNILYFTNLIPPIPLSLKDAGIYHSVVKDADGNYVVSEEAPSAKDFISFFDDYHFVPGEPVYAYSAIFSPAGLDLEIVHRWQYFDEKNIKWVTANVIPLHVSGGREEGHRTYSTKSSIFPGRWRVRVETLRGQVIGTIRFDLVSADSEPRLLHDTKE